MVSRSRTRLATKGSAGASTFSTPLMRFPLTKIRVVADWLIPELAEAAKYANSNR